MTKHQQRLLDVLRSEANRGFDVDELAQRLGTPRAGVVRTASSLVRRGCAIRFTTNLGGTRAMYQSAS